MEIEERNTGMQQQNASELLFDKQKIQNSLNNIQQTLKSIESNSTQFINLSKHGFELQLSDLYQEMAFRVINQNEKQKFIALIYLANDILQKLQDSDFAFKQCLKEVMERICEKIANMEGISHLKTELIRIFQIWMKRNIFEEQDLENWVNQIKSSNKQSQVEQAGNQKELPDNLPPIPVQLVNLSKSKKNIDKQMIDDPNKENKDSFEQSKIGGLMLNYRDTLMLLDKMHMKSVIELKLLLQNIEELETKKQLILDQ